MGVLLMLTAVPTALMAQQHIEKAFEVLKSSDCQEETMSRHHVDKNPETGIVEGMSDEYEFKITKVNAASKQLITDVRNAFAKDREDAYSMESGTDGGAETYTSLAVGNSGRVAIGLMKGSRYMYACFLDPDDSLHRYRYAYAFEWVDKENEIRGRIVKTYATTQNYRRHTRQVRTITVNGDSVNLNEINFGQQGKTSEIWLSEFNTYKTHFLRNPNGWTANSYATQIYKLCKNSNSLEDVEKNLVATEIDRIKKKTKDEFIQQLFDMSIERLKK